MSIEKPQKTSNLVGEEGQSENYIKDLDHDVKGIVTFLGEMDFSSSTNVTNNFLDLTTTTTGIAVLRQFGWSFINPDVGSSGTALITFPEPFSILPYYVNFVKYSQSTEADPPARTFDEKLGDQATQELLRLTTLTGTSMTVETHGGQQNVRQMFFWEAIGQK